MTRTSTFRTHRAAIALIIATLTAATACANPTAAATPPHRPAADQLDGPWNVVAVTDGDTIRVARAGTPGATISVRLLGIDSPETVDPRKPVGCYGPQASANLKQKLAARTVDLEHGPENTDRYGRTLAYVWLGDELVNLTLVTGGWAREFTYAQPAQHAAAIRAAQADARAAGRGLWGACPVTTTQRTRS